MKLKVINSNSKANGYVLTNGEEALVLEAGCKLKDVKKAIDFNVSSIEGLLVTHSHYDHSRFIVEFLSQGIDCLALQDVYSHQRLSGEYCKVAEPKKGYMFGRFKVMPFEVPHDVPTIGYMIEHPDMGRMVFITDTYMVEYTFEGINHLLMEINYADDIMEANYKAGLVSRFVKDRLMHSHMELENAKDMLKANDLKYVNNIILCHLSDNNSNEKRFIDEVASLTGKTVYAAKPGLEIDLSKNPF